MWISLFAHIQESLLLCDVCITALDVISLSDATLLHRLVISFLIALCDIHLVCYTFLFVY